jgi:hypothetical protein
MCQANGVCEEDYWIQVEEKVLFSYLQREKE